MSPNNPKRSVIVNCVTCGKQYQRARYCYIPRGQECKACLGKRVSSHTGFPQCLAKCGPENHRWLGGHAYWMPGRFGKDKDGLSWRKQRAMALDRDGHRCVDCGLTKDQLGKEPDVDHEIPFRICLSHSLENLKCRCPRCHKRYEAKRIEFWSGKILAYKPINRRPACLGCGIRSRIRVRFEGRCWTCHRDTVLIPACVKLRTDGKTLRAIATEMNTSNQVVWLWLERAKLIASVA